MPPACLGVFHVRFYGQKSPAGFPQLGWGSFTFVSRDRSCSASGCPQLGWGSFTFVSRDRSCSASGCPQLGWGSFTFVSRDRSCSASGCPQLGWGTFTFVSRDRKSLRSPDAPSLAGGPSRLFLEAEVALLRDAPSLAGGIRRLAPAAFERARALLRFGVTYCGPAPAAFTHAKWPNSRPPAWLGEFHVCIQGSRPKDRSKDKVVLQCRW